MLLGSSRTWPWGLGNGLMPPSVCTPGRAYLGRGQGTHQVSAKDQVTQDGEPFTHCGAKDPKQPQWGTDPWLPVPSRKTKNQRANRWETELGTPRQLCGGRQAGK